MTRRASILFAASTLWGYQSFIEVPEREYTPKIVVDGAFGPDSTWSVRLALSGALDSDGTVSDWPEITDATVRILGENQPYEQLDHVGGGMYRANAERYPEVGIPYILEVVSPASGSIVAASSVPQLSSSLLSASADPARPFGNCYAEIKVDETNDAGYYVLWLEQATELDDNSGEARSYENVQFQSTTGGMHASPRSVVDLSNLETVDVFFAGAWFARHLLDDGALTIDIDCFSNASRQKPYVFRAILWALSDELFEYEETAEQLEEYLNSSAPFVQRPPIVKSNVEGGLGIFGGYNSHVYEFRHTE